jgi:hypothetical protein
MPKLRWILGVDFVALSIFAFLILPDALTTTYLLTIRIGQEKNPTIQGKSPDRAVLTKLLIDATATLIGAGIALFASLLGGGIRRRSLTQAYREFVTVVIQLRHPIRRATLHFNVWRSSPAALRSSASAVRRKSK